MKCAFCDINITEELSFKNLFSKRDKYNLCKECRTHLYIHEYNVENTKLYYFTDYEFIKKNIYRIKYFGDVLTAKKFKFLFDEFFKAYEFDLITVVPSNNTREIIRGYNHIEIICSLCDIKFTKTLTAKYREKQAKLHTKREKNNIYSLDNNNLKTNNIKKILIIDDIFTSGNTLLSCYEELKKYFVKSEIFFLTLALSKN